MKYIIYKKKIAGPIEDESLDYFIKIWKEKVDAGEADLVPDAPFLSEHMENFPNDVYILEQKSDF